MKTRATMSVSVREAAVRGLTMNRLFSGRKAETIRVEAQSMATIGVHDGEGDSINVSFKSPGLWGLMMLPRNHAIQFALNLLRECGAEHLVRQEVA